MSRLSDIMENHENLDQLLSIIKHYGVNAEYLNTALLQRFEQEAGQNEEGEETEAEDEEMKAIPQELIDDLKQFNARF